MLFVIISSVLFSLNMARATVSPAAAIARAAASAPAEDPKAFEVPFFKSINSLFPSGFTTADNLRRQLVGSRKASDKYYRWNKLYFRQDEIKPLFAAHLSRYVIDPATSRRYKVLEASSLSFQLMDEARGITRKSGVHEVQADAYDTGYVMALKDVYLRTGADEKSRVLTTIPQGTRLAAEKFQNKFALVKYQNYQGYADLSELITKFDFASFVYAGGQWQRVKVRSFDEIVTTAGARIPLNVIRGLITPAERGIIASSAQKIPLWSTIELSRDQVTTWNQSRIKDHGLVWWKPNPEPEQVYYSIDELLKKDIASVSFHPKNPLKGILSSDGVYITENGNSWRRLSRFGNFNGPVHYFNDSLLFVGNFRSTDGGRTFENYIQIDKLASAIEYQFGFFPKKLQVKRIETRAPYRLKIEVDTGSRRIKMESPLFSQKWTAVKS